MIPDEERTVEVLDRAIARTKAKKLTWDSTQEKPTMNFYARVGNSELQVSGKGDGPYYFWLLDADRKILGELVTTAPLMLAFDATEPKDWEPRVINLWQMARRQALKIDAAFDEVLDALDE